MNLEGIILAGGMGTRLSSVWSEGPKPMAPINGKPFLEILLESLFKKGFSRVIMAVSYKHEQISSYFGSRYKTIEIEYVVEESPLGTGGAILEGMSQAISDHVYVFNGDTFLDFEVVKIEKLWLNNSLPIMVLKKVFDGSRFGAVEISSGLIGSFSEKVMSCETLINAGCYVLPKNIFDEVSVENSFSFEKEFLPQYIKNNSMLGFITEGIFIDIGIPGDYKLAQELLGDLCN
jgi:D-glycero-alpha-D-manno-heptose 1-phosphate guanylyltransferase